MSLFTQFVYNEPSRYQFKMTGHYWASFFGNAEFAIHSTNPSYHVHLNHGQSSNVKSWRTIFPPFEGINNTIMLGFVLKHGARVFPVIPEMCVKYMRSNASVCLTKYSLHHLSSLVSTAWWEEGVNNAPYSHISPQRYMCFEYLSFDPCVTKS